MLAPKAPKKPHKITVHQHTRTDDYYWLRDKQNPSVVKHLNAENQYADHWLNQNAQLEQTIFEEIKTRIPQTESSVPFKFDDYYYYNRIEEGQDYPIYCRKKHSLTAPEEVLLNVNEMAKGYAHFSVGMFEVNADETILAYAIDTVGDQIYTVYFKHLPTGTLLPDVLTNVCHFSWANLPHVLYYTVYDRSLRPHKVYRHLLGNTQKMSELIFYEKNPRFSCIAYRCQSKQFLFIDTDSNTSSEVWYVDANNPNAAPVLVQKRRPNMEYSIDHYNQHFYILTNYQAPNYRLMRCPIANTPLEQWEEIIPHRATVLLEDFHIFKDYLALEERINGLPQIRIKAWNKPDEDYYLHFPDATYTASVGDNYAYDTTLLRYVYSSLNCPTQVFDFDMATRSQTLLKQFDVLGNFDAAMYQSEYLFAPATDGKQVPISLVYRKDLFNKDGSNPMLLYAYGAYGLVNEPYFSHTLLTLLDRGFVYAMAHVRGGEELGRQWYEEGRLLKKQNSFTDFIACIQFLTHKGYTLPQRLILEGGSAGGMLVAAVLNQQPGLCHAAILQVPFLDVLTTMLDKDLPLTIGEYEEWGNPNTEKYYRYILQYSPYDNLKPQPYPHLFITAAFNDTNVPYWEAVKYAAKLRTLKTDNNLLLLKIDMDSGHQGPSGRYDSYKETAQEYAFMLAVLDTQT